MDAKLQMTRLKELFPDIYARATKWTPNKDGSIKLELEKHKFVIFTCSDERMWRLESVRMHEK